MQDIPFFNTYKGIIRQTILSLCVSMSYFCIGLVRGYSSPAMPSMEDLNPDLLPTKYIVAWASSVPPCAAFFGSIIAGPLMHYIGQKYTILTAAPIWVLSWMIIANATNWHYVMGGRILSGFCVGLTLPSAQIYVTECTDPKVRGVIGSFPSISMSAGVLTAYIFGTFFTWSNLARSIEWLGLEPKAKIIASNDVMEKGSIKVAAKIPCQGNMTIENKPHSWETLMTRPILMPLTIGLTLLSIQQLSGVDSIIFFTVEIFRSSGSSIDGNVATIIVGAVQLVSNITSLLFVDKSGRKPLLIVSGVIMAISNASMGAAFYFNQHGNKSFGYLPLVSLIVFMNGFSAGFGCIPFLLMGEIFPSAQRSLLSSMAGSLNLGIMFVVITSYHPLEEVITTAGTFWMYSAFCTIGVFFVIFLVPETKGRDLDSMAKLFLRKESTVLFNKSKEIDVDLDLDKKKQNGQEKCDTHVEISTF